MRILSKYTDCYDYVQYIGEYNNRDIVFDRNENQKQVNNKYVLMNDDIDKISSLYYKFLKHNGIDRSRIVLCYENNVTISLGIIIIGEYFHPVLIIKSILNEHNTSKPTVTNMFVHYTLDLTSITTNINIIKQHIKNNKFNYYEYIADDLIKKHFKINYTDLYNNIRKFIKNPIILIEDYGNITIDHCNLKKYKINNLISNEQIFQEIEMYLGKLKSIEKDTEFSSEIKRDYAGFNEWSFKNEKK